MAAWPAKPAATDVVAHATVGEMSATGAGSDRFAASAKISTHDHANSVSDFSTAPSQWFSGSDGDG
jgi:hypothetical protein